MRNEISANRRVLSFIVAFAIILSGFTNLITDYSYADSTKYKTVRIDGKEVDIKNSDFNAQYEKEYEKMLKELQQSGYKTVNTKFDTKTETILSNSTSPEGNSKGKYLLENQKWYWQTSWLHNASSGSNTDYTALIGLKNSITGKTVHAYCIDLFTYLKNGADYNNEYIELLKYNQNAFVENADKLRTIALNSYPNKSLSELQRISGVDNLTEKEAVRATQYLIWSKAHGLKFQELYLNNENYGMGMKKSDKDYVFLSPQARTAAQTKANSERIYKLIQALDEIPVVNQLSSIAEPKIDIRKVNFERNTNRTDIKVSFEYKFDGKNQDGTALSQDFKYYVGNRELKASEIKNITYTGLTGGYNLVEFYLSPDNFKNNEDLKISVKAIQKINIINALFSTTNNNKATQTVITTQNVESLRNVIKEATISSKENTNKYTVSFKKVDKDELDKASDNSDLSSALKGSKLQLLDYKNNIVNTVITDENGLAKFSNLRAGSYTLKELESPESYEKVSESMKVLVKEDGEVLIQAYGTVYSSDDKILPVPNKKLEKVEITVSKVWENVDNPSANTATVVLYQNGQATQNKKTITGNSTVKFTDLQKYAQDGKAYEYSIVEEKVAGFTSKVEKQGNVYKLINTKIVLTGQLDFTKTEFSTDAAVPGAIITIYEADTHKEVVQGTTDAQGKINNATIGAEKVKNGKITLEVGRYYFKETNAPAGYVLNDAPQYFEIKENEITPAKLENKKEQTQENIDFTVKKVWLNPLRKSIVNPDYTVEIDMYRDGHRIATKQIGVEGKVVFEKMPKLDPATNKPYNYTFEERDPSTDIAQFISKEIKGNEVIFTNRLRGGCFNFITEDETGTPLAGAVVGVYEEGTNRLLFEGITDSQGKLSKLTNGYEERIKDDKRIVMELGNYYLKEIKAPDGYELNTEKVKFTVHEYTCTPLLKIVHKLSQTQENIDFTVNKVWLNPLSKPIANHNYELDIDMYRDGHKIATKRMGTEGKVVFEKMPKLDSATNKPYNYTFEETNPSTDIAQFISKEIKGNEVIFTNRLRGGCFNFITEDETGTPLAGAVVGVYEEGTDKLLFEGITDSQGKLSKLTNGYEERIKDDKRIVMELGNYYLKEIKAPDGYELNTEKVKFTVHEYTCTPLLKIVHKLSQTQENIDFTVNKVWLNPLNKPIANPIYTVEIDMYRDGHRIATKQMGTEGKVVFEKMPKLDPATNKPYNYTFEERDASTNIAQFISKEVKGNEVTFINRLRGGCFNFVKEDETGAPLAGAVIGVYEAGTNRLLFEGTTDDEGKLSNLTNGYQDRIKVDKRIVMELGNYYLKEIKAPAGYELSDERIDFTVEEYTCTPLLKIVNQKTQEEKLTLIVEKVWQDATGTPIKDNNYEITIEIYQNGNKIGEKKIIGNSTVEFENLPKLDPKTNQPYNYEFKEKDPTVESTPVSKDTVGNKTTIVSKLVSGELDFTKTEFSTDKAVEGATITIYRQANDEVVVQGITDAQGKISNPTVGANRVKEGKIVLEVGQYYFIETNAPAGYVLNDAKQPFEIRKDTVEKAKFENKKQQTQDTNIDFTVKKVWLNPLNNPIANHDYKLDIEIYRDGHRIGIKPVGQDGTVVFENMPKLNPSTNQPYNYTFVETNPSTDIAQFISQEREGDVITFTNRLRGGCFDFVKQDEMGAPLAGAVIGVYDAKTDKLLFEGTTNDQGKLDNLTNGYQDRVKVDRRIVMELGDYYLKEIKAPDGYELSDERVDFTVNEYTCTPLLKIINKKTTGFATIINKDGSTQKPIPNGVFDIYKNVNGQPSGTPIQIGLVILESGTTIQLPFGDYIAVLVSPPTGGYELPNLIYDRYFTFTVDSSNTKDNPREVIVYHNKPSGPVNPTTSPVLYVTTIDEIRNPIGGATVEIYKIGETTPIIGGNTNVHGKLDKDTAYGIQKDNIQPDGRIELEFGDYEIKETNAPTGYIGPTDIKYISLTTANMIGIVELINKKDIPTPVLISIIVNEKWINIESGKTSDDYKATVKLIRNGIEIDTVIITGDNSHTFDNLPKQDNNGQDYVYEVVQQLESGTREISKTKQGEYVFDFVNEPMPSTAKGEVIVKYIVVDENGNSTGVVLSEEKLTGDVGVPYNTQQKEFDNYTFVKVDETKGPKSGEFKAQVQEVVYEYKQKSSNGGGGTNPPATKGTVKVSYIVVDENGNPTGETLEGPTVLTGEIGTAYNTVQKTFAGYEFVRVNPNKAPANGQFSTTEQEVVYEYKKLPAIEGKVTVKYIVVDEKGNPTGEVLEGPTTIAGVVGTSYTTEQKSFTNYVFVRVNPDKAPATGNFEATDKEVVYEYKKVPAGQSKVIVKYIVIDENGNPTSQILEQNELIGTVGQPYTTVKKDFAGYSFVKVDDTKAGVSGNFKILEQEVVYQYKAHGKVTVKYIVVDSNNNPTGTILEGPTTITGEVGTAYSVEQKAFSGYTFVRVNPDKSAQNGNFKSTEQEVVFEYRVSTSGGTSSGGGGTGGTGGPSNSGTTNTDNNSTESQSPRARIISEIVGTGNRSDSFNVSEEEVPKSTPKIEIMQEEVPKSVPDKIIRSLEDDNVPKSAPIMVSEVKSNNQPRLPKTGENNTTAMGFALLGLGLISLIKRRKTN